MRENAPSDSRSSWVLADNRVIVVLVLDFLELFDHWVFPATSCVIWWQDGRGGTCPWHNHPPRPGLRQRTAPCTFCGSAESENHHDDLSTFQPFSLPWPLIDSSACVFAYLMNCLDDWKLHYENSEKFIVIFSDDSLSMRKLLQSVLNRCRKSKNFLMKTILIYSLITNS